MRQVPSICLQHPIQFSHCCVYRTKYPSGLVRVLFRVLESYLLAIFSLSAYVEFHYVRISSPFMSGCAFPPSSPVVVARGSSSHPSTTGRMPLSGSKGRPPGGLGTPHFEESQKCHWFPVGVLASVPQPGIGGPGEWWASPPPQP